MPSAFEKESYGCEAPLKKTKNVSSVPVPFKNCYFLDFLIFLGFSFFKLLFFIMFCYSLEFRFFRVFAKCTDAKRL